MHFIPQFQGGVYTEYFVHIDVHKYNIKNPALFNITD